MSLAGPAKPWRRRAHTAALLVAPAILVVAALALTAVSVEPLRAHTWMTIGQQCGTVVGSVRHGHDFTTDDVCLQTAWLLDCHPASLTYMQNSLDTQLTITLVVEPAVPVLAPCAIAAIWVNNVDAGAIRRSGVEHCAAVDYEDDGLHAQSCGALGSFVVPR